MAEGGCRREPVEVTALRTNLNAIAEAVTVGDTIQWFSYCLVGNSFISGRAARGILRDNSTPRAKVNELLESVLNVIRATDEKRQRFEQFVSIFSNEPVYDGLATKLQLEVTKMAANREPPEITALRSNLTSITDTVTVGGNLQWFVNRLVEKAFITQRAVQEILGSATTPTNKASQLIDSVFVAIRMSDRKRLWFDEFVSIFSTDRAYSELVEKLQRCVIETSPAPSVFPLQPILQPTANSASPVPSSRARDSEHTSALSSTATSSSPPQIQPDQPPSFNASEGMIMKPKVIFSLTQTLE